MAIKIITPAVAADLQAVTTTGNTTTVGIVVNGATVSVQGGGNDVLIENNNIQFGDGAHNLKMLNAALTANQTQTFQNASGVVALQGDIPATPTIDQVLLAGNNATSTGLVLTDQTVKSINSAGSRSVELDAPNINMLIGNLLVLTPAAQTANHTQTFPDGTGDIIVKGVNLKRGTGTLATGRITITDALVTSNTAIVPAYLNLSKTVSGNYGPLKVVITAGTNYRIQACNLDGSDDATNISSICWLLMYV
jgi:hypothetical protein